MKRLLIVLVLLMFPIVASASLLDIQNGFFQNVTLDVGAYYDLTSGNALAGVSTAIITYKAVGLRVGYTGDTASKDSWIGSFSIDLKQVCTVNYILSLLDLYPGFYIGRDFTNNSWKYGVCVNLVFLGTAPTPTKN